MHILPLVNVERPLILLVGDWISLHGPDHHLVAVHVVVHHILQLRHQRFWIYQVEVDELICCNLNSYISSNKVDEPSVLHFMIELPRSCALDFIIDLLKEKNPTRTSDAQCLVKEKLHLAQIKSWDSLIPVICKVFRLYCEYLALPVQSDDFVSDDAIEALVWEVLYWSV